MWDMADDFSDANGFVWMEESNERSKNMFAKLSRNIESKDSHRRLENEPRLFTREEVTKFMQDAINLYAMTGKFPKDSELDSLLP